MTEIVLLVYSGNVMSSIFIQKLFLKELKTFFHIKDGSISNFIYTKNKRELIIRSSYSKKPN